MKIRKGFVSNSSSSSFVLVGHEITLDEIKDFENVYFCGDYLCEGEDLFLMDDEFKNAAITYGFNRFTYFVAVRAGSTEGEKFYITKEDIDKSGRDKVEVYSCEKDYHTSDGRGVDDFIDRYQRNNW